MCVCVCVCVCVWCWYVYNIILSIYIYMCVCAYVCVRKRILYLSAQGNSIGSYVATKQIMFFRIFRILEPT